MASLRCLAGPVARLIIARVSPAGGGVIVISFWGSVCLLPHLRTRNVGGVLRCCGARVAAAVAWLLLPLWPSVVFVLFLPSGRCAPASRSDLRPRG